MYLQVHYCSLSPPAFVPIWAEIKRLIETHRDHIDMYKRDNGVGM
jgi:hypothetical protein